jgi:hypothetical protein
MSTNLSTTHVWWLEVVMGHDIREIHHLPGTVNFVGDALSRKYTNMPRTDSDGSNWSVDCDWFAEGGLAFDLYTVSKAEDVEALKKQFAGVPVWRGCMADMWKSIHTLVSTLQYHAPILCYSICLYSK